MPAYVCHDSTNRIMHYAALIRHGYSNYNTSYEEKKYFFYPMDRAWTDSWEPGYEPTSHNNLYNVDFYIKDSPIYISCNSDRRYKRNVAYVSETRDYSLTGTDAAPIVKVSTVNNSTIKAGDMEATNACGMAFNSSNMFGCATASSISTNMDYLIDSSKTRWKNQNLYQVQRDSAGASGVVNATLGGMWNDVTGSAAYPTPINMYGTVNADHLYGMYMDKEPLAMGVLACYNAVPVGCTYIYPNAKTIWGIYSSSGYNDDYVIGQLSTETSVKDAYTPSINVAPFYYTKIETRTMQSLDYDIYYAVKANKFGHERVTPNIHLKYATDVVGGMIYSMPIWLFTRVDKTKAAYVKLLSEYITALTTGED